MKALPREVRAETEGLGRELLGGAAGSLLFLLSLGSVSPETGGERRCQNSRSPGRRRFWSPGSVLVGRLGSLGAEGTEHRRGQKGKAVLVRPGVSCPGNTRFQRARRGRAGEEPGAVPR